MCVCVYVLCVCVCVCVSVGVSVFVRASACVCVSEAPRVQTRPGLLAPATRHSIHTKRQGTHSEHSTELHQHSTEQHQACFCSTECFSDIQECFSLRNLSTKTLLGGFIWVTLYQKKQLNITGKHSNVDWYIINWYILLRITISYIQLDQVLYDFIYLQWTKRHRDQIQGTLLRPSRNDQIYVCQMRGPDVIADKTV